MEEIKYLLRKHKIIKFIWGKTLIKERTKSIYDKKVELPNILRLVRKMVYCLLFLSTSEDILLKK